MGTFGSIFVTVAGVVVVVVVFRSVISELYYVTNPNPRKYVEGVPGSHPVRKNKLVLGV